MPQLVGTLEAAGAGPARPPAPSPVASKVRLISVRVEDRAGVLQRVTNCLGRRGLRLRGCSVAEGSDPGVLNLWLRVDPGIQPPDQITKQLTKLIDVVEVEDLTSATPLEWSTALMEFRPQGREAELEAELERLQARVVERGRGRLLATLGGPPATVEAALDRLRPLALVDWVYGRPLALVGSAPGLRNRRPEGS